MIKTTAIAVTNGYTTWHYKLGEPEPGTVTGHIVVAITKSWDRTPRLDEYDSIGQVYFDGYDVYLSNEEILHIPPHSTVYTTRKEVSVT